MSYRFNFTHFLYTMFKFECYRVKININAVKTLLYRNFNCKYLVHTSFSLPRPSSLTFPSVTSTSLSVKTLPYTAKLTYPSIIITFMYTTFNFMQRYNNYLLPLTWYFFLSPWISDTYILSLSPLYSNISTVISSMSAALPHLSLSIAFFYFIYIIYFLHTHTHTHHPTHHPTPHTRTFHPFP